MKTKLVLSLTVVVCVCAALLARVSHEKKDQAVAIFSTVEVLTETEPTDGDRIKCYCMAWWQTDDDCAVDGGDKDALCAQSKPGENIICSEYNGNCK